MKIERVWEILNKIGNVTVAVKDVEDGRLIEVMQKVKAAGKVRFIGASIKIPDAYGFIETGAFDTLQIPYSALETSHEELVSRTASVGIGTIIRGAVAQGSAFNTRKQVVDKWKRWERACLDELLAPGQSHTQFLISYLLANPAIDTMIVGTITADHFDSNIAALVYGPLSQETCEEVRRRLTHADQM